MKSKLPPRWLERILLYTLPERDKPTVSGDLAEEFEEQLRVRKSQLGATLWYARQILSFVPAWIGAQVAIRFLLFSICSLTALCGLWLGAMGLRLRHPGYEEGEVISCMIVSQALLTIAALRYRQKPTLRYLSGVGCLPLFWLASEALKGIIDGSNFEGYILLIALALLVQAVLTLTMILGDRSRSHIQT